MHRRALLAGALATSACASLTPFDRANPERDGAFRAMVEALGAEPAADATPAGAAALRNAAQDRWTELSAFGGRLSDEMRILREAIMTGARAETDLARNFPFGAGNSPYVVTPRAGAHRRINAANTADPERAAALARDLDGETERLRSDARAGIIPPAFLLARTLTALDAAAPQAGAAIGPALLRQREALASLQANAPADPGVSHLPDGEDYYRDLLALRLGQEINPRDAHDQARARAAALQGEAHLLLRAQNLTNGDVATRLRTLLRDERYLLSADDAGKTQAVAAMNASLADIRARLPRAFAADLAQTPAEVRRMSAEDEARGAAGRREGGAYVVDLTRIRTRPIWTLPSVVAHETIPGHALQARAEAGADVPRLQARYAGGYAEGWTTYAEQVADELGLYANDPRGRLGYLHWALFRIGRVIVDTGVHAQGWSRDRAIEEMRAIQGDSIAFISIEDDVERICAEPGVYAAQGLTAMAIADLRDHVEHRAGFTLSRFHDAILRRGPLSPPALTRAVELAFAN